MKAGTAEMTEKERRAIAWGESLRETITDYVDGFDEFKDQIDKDPVSALRWSIDHFERAGHLSAYRVVARIWDDRTDHPLARLRFISDCAIGEIFRRSQDTGAAANPTASLLQRCQLLSLIHI